MLCRNGDDAGNDGDTEENKDEEDATFAGCCCPFASDVWGVVRVRNKNDCRIRRITTRPLLETDDAAVPVLVLVSGSE